MQDVPNLDRVSRLHESVVGIRNLLTGDIPMPDTLAEISLQGLQLAVGKPVLPQPPALVEHVDVDVVQPEGHAVEEGPVSDVGQIVGLAVEADQDLCGRHQPREMVEQGRLLRVVTRQKLVRNQVAVGEAQDAHEEGGVPAESPVVSISR